MLLLLFAASCMGMGLYCFYLHSRVICPADIRFYLGLTAFFNICGVLFLSLDSAGSRICDAIHAAGRVV